MPSPLIVSPTRQKARLVLLSRSRHEDQPRILATTISALLFPCVGFYCSYVRSVWILRHHGAVCLAAWAAILGPLVRFPGLLDSFHGRSLMALSCRISMVLGHCSALAAEKTGEIRADRPSFGSGLLGSLIRVGSSSYRCPPMPLARDSQKEQPAQVWSTGLYRVLHIVRQWQDEAGTSAEQAEKR